MLRIRPLAVAAFALACAGCSIHPIPDNLTEYSTDQIVRNVRCEAKDTVRERIRDVLLERPGLEHIVPDEITQPANFERIKRLAPDLALKFQNYMASSIAYSFEFNINERNTASASAGFSMPFTSGGAWGFGGGGGVLKIRDGVRKFNTFETFSDLIKLDCFRHRYVKPDPNIVHPLTGSVGIARVMNTFINLTELGGARDTYTDQLTFTTKFDANASSGLVLLPVKDSVRLVKADAAITAERTDIHKLIVSLSFPKQDIRIAGLDGRASIANIEALGRDSTRRAQEDLCIAREEEREDRVGTLRQIPPAEFCRREFRRLP